MIRGFPPRSKSRIKSSGDSAAAAASTASGNRRRGTSSLARAYSSPIRESARIPKAFGGNPGQRRAIRCKLVALSAIDRVDHIQQTHVPYGKGNPLGANNHRTFEDLSKWGKGPQESLPHDRQQYVRPAGAERRRQIDADAHRRHTAGPRQRHDLPRRHRRAEGEEHDPQAARLPAAGVRRLPQALGARHADPSGGAEGHRPTGPSAKTSSTLCSSRPTCGTCARRR